MVLLFVVLALLLGFALGAFTVWGLQARKELAALRAKAQAEEASVLARLQALLTPVASQVTLTPSTPQEDQP